MVVRQVADVFAVCVDDVDVGRIAITAALDQRPVGPFQVHGLDDDLAGWKSAGLPRRDAEAGAQEPDGQEPGDDHGANVPAPRSLMNVFDGDGVVAFDNERMELAGQLSNLPEPLQTLVALRGGQSDESLAETLA